MNILILSGWLPCLINVFELEIKGSSNYQEVPTLAPFLHSSCDLSRLLLKGPKDYPELSRDTHTPFLFEIHWLSSSS